LTLIRPIAVPVPVPVLALVLVPELVFRSLPESARPAFPA
jgi:hypothetical protein